MPGTRRQVANVKLLKQGCKLQFGSAAVRGGSDRQHLSAALGGAVDIADVGPVVLRVRLLRDPAERDRVCHVSVVSQKIGPVQLPVLGKPELNCLSKTESTVARDPQATVYGESQMTCLWHEQSHV